MVKYTKWLMIDVKFDRLVKFSNCPIQRLLLGSQLTKLFAALPTFIVAEAALHAEDGRCRGEGGG